MAQWDPQFNYGVMPRIARPADPNNPDQVRAYRMALARRHLRGLVGRSADGAYDNGNMWNLFEIVFYIVEYRDYTKDAKSLRAAIDAILKKRGLPMFTEYQQCNRFRGASQEQVDAICEAIAASEFDIPALVRREQSSSSDEKCGASWERDLTVERAIFYYYHALNTKAKTEFVIRGVNNPAALDETLWPNFAALKQQLISKQTGEYAYVPEADGTFAIAAFEPDWLPKVREALVAAGVETISEVTLPLTPKQQERRVREIRDEAARAEYLKQHPEHR